MKCPQCGSETKCRYVQKKEKKKSRENFEARCFRCGFKGEIRPINGNLPVVE